MRESLGFTLLEVVLAAAMLAMVVALCARVIQVPLVHPGPMLTSAFTISESSGNRNPALDFNSHVGDSINGRWRVSQHSHGIVLVWVRSSESQP